VLKMQIWIGIHRSGPILLINQHRPADDVAELEVTDLLEMSWDGSSATRKPSRAIV
jgi:hypothetical protein